MRQPCKRQYARRTKRQARSQPSLEMLRSKSSSKSRLAPAFMAPFTPVLRNATNTDGPPPSTPCIIWSGLALLGNFRNERNGPGASNNYPWYADGGTHDTSPLCKVKGVRRCHVSAEAPLSHRKATSTVKHSHKQTSNKRGVHDRMLQPAGLESTSLPRPVTARSRTDAKNYIAAATEAPTLRIWYNKAYRPTLSDPSRRERTMSSTCASHAQLLHIIGRGENASQIGAPKRIRSIAHDPRMAPQGCRPQAPNHNILPIQGRATLYARVARWRLTVEYGGGIGVFCWGELSGNAVPKLSWHHGGSHQIRRQDRG